MWLVVYHFVVHWTGGDYGAPAYGYLQPYDWLSGIAGLSLMSVAYTHWRRHNCEVRGCWRIGRHKSAADQMLCRRHHPDDHLTAKGAIAAHEAASQRDVAPAA